MPSSTDTHAPTHIEVDLPDPRMWRLFQPLVWTVAVFSTIAWFNAGQPVDWAIVASLTVVGAGSDLFAIRIQQKMRVSTIHFAIPFAMVATGMTGAIIVAAVSLSTRLIFNRKDWNTFDLAVNVSTTGISGLALTALSPLNTDSILIAGITAVMVFAFVRSLINLGWAMEARSKGFNIPQISGQISALMIACAALFAPAVSLYASAKNPIYTVAVIALPYLATQYLLRTFGRERELIVSLEDANLSLAESLVNALDARDAYSAGHSVAVAVYARDIAIDIGLDEPRVARIYLAGLLHDIGKIAVPDVVLRKPSALSDEEFAEIKKHPVVGEQILRPSRHFEDILPAVRSHHERMDGKGYPDGLTADEIPLDAKIIAVADAYNAMTSQRPYRDAMKPELACKILTQNQGMQHDAFLVAAFQRVLDAKPHEYAIAEGPDFATSAAMQELLDNSGAANSIRTLRSA